MPYFSVIIPSFNRRQKLCRAIDSVLSQSFRDYELIIIDDGSTDGTDSIALQYKGKISYFFQENQGVSSARNKGISVSNSPFIAFLDSDDTWDKRKLARHKEYIESNPHILIHQTEDIWIRNDRFVNPQKKHLKREGDIFEQSLHLCMISPSSVVMSREIFDKYGYFDEELPACEDYDLWLRITPFEYIGLIKEKLITRYAGHSDQLSASFELMDRFRVYSLMKLLEIHKDNLSPEQYKKARTVAIEKTKILLHGSIKREDFTKAQILQRILNSLESEIYKKKDYQILLQLHNPHGHKS